METSKGVTKNKGSSARKWLNTGLEKLIETGIGKALDLILKYYPSFSIIAAYTFKKNWSPVEKLLVAGILVLLAILSLLILLLKKLDTMHNSPNKEEEENQM